MIPIGRRVFGIIDPTMGKEEAVKRKRFSIKQRVGLRTNPMVFKHGGKILSNNNVVVPTGFEPVFKP